MAGSTQASLDRHNQEFTINENGKRRIILPHQPREKHAYPEAISSAAGDVDRRPSRSKMDASDRHNRALPPGMIVTTPIDATDVSTHSLFYVGANEDQQGVDKTHDIKDRTKEDPLDPEKNGEGSNAANSDSLSPRGSEKGYQEGEAAVGDVVERQDGIHTEVDKNGKDADVVDTSASPSSLPRGLGAHPEDNVATRDNAEGRLEDKHADGSRRDGVDTVVDNEPETEDGAENVADLVKCEGTKRWIPVAEEILVVIGFDEKQTTIAVGISCRPVQAKARAPKFFKFRRDFPDGYARIKNKDQLTNPPIPDGYFGALSRPCVDWILSLADAANDEAKSSHWRQRSVEKSWHDKYGKRFDKD